MRDEKISVVWAEAVTPLGDQEISEMVRDLRSRRAEMLRERGFPDGRMDDDLVHLPWLVQSTSNLRDKVFNAGVLLGLLDKWADGKWDTEMFYYDCLFHHLIAERLQKDTHENRIAWDAEEIAKASLFAEDANSFAFWAASSCRGWCEHFKTFDMPEEQRRATVESKLGTMIKKWEAIGWGDYIPREPRRRIPELREPVIY